MLIIVLATILIVEIMNKDEKANDKFKVITSFYPMYVIAENIIGDTEGIELVSLTNYTTGCLHDYQLSTSDMKRLENGDVIIINGGGMENFMGDVLEAYPDLPVINASEGIKLLPGTAHEHDDGNNSSDNQDDSDHDEEYNAHVWMDMDYYMQQVQNVMNSLGDIYPEDAAFFQENGKQYLKKITALKEKFESSLKNIEGEKVVVFHDAFSYLAKEIGLEVVHVVDMDSETSLSAGEIAEVVDEVNKDQVKVLFTEEQYSASIASNIAKETGAKVYIIDSIVTGDMNKDAYITAMEKNLTALKDAFKN